MKLVIIILSFISVWSCNAKKENKTNTQNDISTIFWGDKNLPVVFKKKDRLKTKKEQVAPQIDTLSLRDFWVNFQKNISEDNKQEVTKVLNFPVRAIYPVIFKFSYDCDTISYIQNEEKYNNFDITKENVEEYYDFLFSGVLKKAISQTTVDDLLKKGIRYEDNSGITYQIFPKNYIKVDCPNDHLIRLHISYKETTHWSISISGL